MTSGRLRTDTPLGSALGAPAQASRRSSGYARARSALAAAFCLLAAACAGPMLPFETDSPPLVLTTVGQAGIADGRARFREIFCTVLERDGETCGAHLWRVGA